MESIDCDLGHRQRRVFSVPFLNTAPMIVDSSRHSFGAPLSSFFTDCSVELFPDNLDTGSLSTPTATVSSEVPALSDGPTTDVQTESPRNSTRVSKPPVYLHDYYCFSTILSQDMGNNK